MGKIVIIICIKELNDELISTITYLKKIEIKNIVVVNYGKNTEVVKILNKIKDDKNIIIIDDKENIGRGHALKEGLKFANSNYKNAIGFVIVDGNENYFALDILKISKKLEEDSKIGKANLILGQRDFSNNISKINKFFNKISSIFFKMQTGILINDIQTKLIGIPKKLVDKAIHIDGKNYDYEVNIINEFASDKDKAEIILVDIDTKYKDSCNERKIRKILNFFIIFKQLIRFALVAILSFAIDIGFFTLFVHLFGEGKVYIALSVVIARIISGTFNFWGNKKWSFESKKDVKIQIYKYLALFITQMIVSSLIVTILSVLPINITLIKLMVDGIIFFVNYFIQKRYIF